VWRLRSPNGGSVIVKRGTHEMVTEFDTYTQLVQPLGLPAPEIFEIQQTPDSVIFAMSDVGDVTLEQRPSLDGYLSAVALLATIRTSATAAMQGNPPIPLVSPGHFVDFIERIDVGLPVVRPDLAQPLDAVARIARQHLDRLYDSVPATVVHGDYVSKNLVFGDRGLTTVDWPSACISPHLGDLFSIVREADQLSLSRAELLSGYEKALSQLGSATDPATPLGWQLAVGGLCWTLEAVRWIVEEGSRTVPESITWLDDLIRQLFEVVDTLDNYRRKP
jgi:aminoglycoside/choline kinase family phosphotransferase